MTELITFKEFDLSPQLLKALAKKVTVVQQLFNKRRFQLHLKGVIC